MQTVSPNPTPANPSTAPADVPPERAASHPALPRINGHASHEELPPPPPQQHGPPRLLVALALLAAVVGAGWWIWTTRLTAAPNGMMTASGTLEADEVLVSSEVSGRILGLAREGDTVQAGQSLVRLDDSLVQLQIRQVDAANQQQLVIQAEKFQLRTPISGVVTRVPLHTGEVVAPGQTVLAVADLSTLDLTAYVLERDLGKVRVGQRVAVTADPFPARTFSGVVTSTKQQAEFTPRNVQTQRDRLNLVFGVKIRVENPDGALKPGMPADATFEPLS
ncbi:MAG: efflux RND transporter periplasmic adaptor subunit [Chloroflexi bacterium]|nr:efflux RND transporter periplasmic adaptor subunit [Chloroflexota bacterium]